MTATHVVATLTDCSYTTLLDSTEPNPVDLDDLDLTIIAPLPPYVWYQDMVDFADGRAVNWLAEEGLIDQDAVRQFEQVNPVPDLP